MLSASRRVLDCGGKKKTGSISVQKEKTIYDENAIVPKSLLKPSSNKPSLKQPGRGFREITNAVAQHQPAQENVLKLKKPISNTENTCDLGTQKRKPLGNLKNLEPNLPAKMKLHKRVSQPKPAPKDDQNSKANFKENIPPLVSTALLDEIDFRDEPIEYSHAPKKSLLNDFDEQVHEMMWPKSLRADRFGDASIFDRLFASCYRAENASPQPAPMITEVPGEMERLDAELEELLKKLNDF